MRNYLLILFFSISCFNVLGQTDFENKCLGLIDKGKYDQALLLINQEITDRKTAFLIYLKGRAEYEQSQYNEAIADLKNAQAIADTISDEYFKKKVKATSLVYIGKCFLNTGQKELAIFYLKKAVDVESNDLVMGLAVKMLKELGNNYGNTKINKIILIGEKVPEFELTDIYGKTHNLKKLLATPIVLHFGTTWCGGCQMDARNYDSFAESYLDKGIQFMHIFIGETPNTVLDYLKHYRSNMFALIDYDNKIAYQYKARPYTSTFLIDKARTNLFNNHDIFYNNKQNQLKSAINKMQLDSNAENTKAICTINSCYIPVHENDTAVYELAPKAVADNNKNIWVTFYSNKNGNNDIFLRCYEKEKMILEYQITRYSSDEYSPDITISPDQTIWLSWVSNLNGKYDIYTCSFKNNVFSTPTQVTTSVDDAFHPSLISDNENNIHLTYYKWSFLQKYSRDRDVYYNSFNGKEWSPENRVSPTEPDYDDATDPSIICDNKKNIFIVYSYDYHPGASKPLEPVSEPTIFMQKISDNFNPNEQTLIGTKETTYKNVIDITPSLAVDSKNNIWCAWDALANETRYIFVKKASDNSEIILSEKAAISINPCIKISNNDVPFVVWSQETKGRWGIVGCKFENGFWSSPQKMFVGQDNCKEPILVIVGNDKYIAFTEYLDNGSKINLKKTKL